ncbi:uncharacterized protein K452DRAFT_285088 [Aplosporella prunicola CBS 121167]|uniref:Uncharacterized protein n=1 Tax=Aplosporella prunicola CBS 121167 TaxID=1176127 RepID=A0A6A6BM58_9PEZI|nr:uncharacterized protein K452DRAFT_285088 [Aplosporella prunicola CBS 121167]KAF2144758.1 hypothetical protein K452DRAFT_285088 [Aplosporella prunicola CBS 121167]
MGHCRAQRFEMDAINQAVYNTQKASYEENWDRYDCWRQNKPDAKVTVSVKDEEEYSGCCCDDDKSSATSTKKTEAAPATTASLVPPRPALSRSDSANSVCSTASRASLWTPRSASPCSRCQCGGSSSHL